MITLLLDRIPYEQDIRELFMAFYPGESFQHEASGDAGICLRGSFREEENRYELVLEDGGESAFSVPVLEDRFSTKCALKTALYEVLSRRTGRQLPWGTLTGIRPTRLILDDLDRGKRPEEIRKYFTDTFLLSGEKLDLCMEIAQKEHQILRGVDHYGGWSLYLGIPFCPTTCLYCSFTSYPIEAWRGRADAYVDSLCAEIRQTASRQEGIPLHTVYMGGGTPTALEPEQLRRILQTVRESFDRRELRELTVEAGRPDSITPEKLEAILEGGATRISINPQTMNDRTLRVIGRNHDSAMIRERFLLARSMGFQNINMDLIAGLPGESPEDMARTLEAVGELDPESITVHTLALKHSSRLHRQLEAYPLPDGDAVSEMLAMADRHCRDAGLGPYYMYRQKNMTGNFENTGYSKPGKECLYNILIMEERQTILGCGAGTSSKTALGLGRGVERTARTRDPELYIEQIRKETL